MISVPLTIKKTQKALLEKEFSTVELVTSYIKHIKNDNKNINCYLTVCESEALSDAKNTDRLISELGEKIKIQKPLFGVTAGVKDLFLTKGIRTTAGSKLLENYIAPYSATSINKLEESGVIILGKTNCDAWAHGASGENSDFGPTLNPWNRKYVPGGSSSGSAASMAANFNLIALGTDTGGSIRQPANFCYSYGLKPTYGTVSRYGVIAMASSLDCVGGFARTADDLESVFSIMKGIDGKDSTLKESDGKGKLKKLKLGLPKEYFSESTDSEIRENVERAGAIFERMGIEVLGITLPHTQYAISVYYIIQPAEVSSNLGRFDGIKYGDSRESFSSEAKRRIMLGTYVLSSGYYDAYYLKAMKVRSLIIEDFNSAFEKVDLILAPVSPTSAFFLNEKSKDPLKMYLADIYTVSANLAGIPSIAVPFGFDKNNMPLGFQLMGRKFDEKTIFDVCRQFENASDYLPEVAKL